MATGVVSWSKTAATNATADSAQNWAEGMAPSAVNDSARGGMASVAKYRDDTAGTLTTGGTSTAYTVSTNQGFATLAAMDGAELTIKFNAANGASPTLAVDGLAAKPINVSVATAVGTGVIAANSIWSVTYDNANAMFMLRGVPAQVQDGTVATASIASGAVATASIASGAVTAAKLASGAVTSASVAASFLPFAAGMLNGTIVESHSGNAVTFNIKTLAGVDPSSSDPTSFIFRDATVGNGDYVVVTVAAALSITIPSSKGMGFANATPGRVWLGALNNAGTVELFVVNCYNSSGPSIYPLQGWGIITTSAVSGATAAAVAYSTTARTSVAYIPLGYMTWEAGGTLATAGTWNASPTRIQIYGPGVPLPGSAIQFVSASSASVGTALSTTFVALSSGTTVSISPTSSANIIKAETSGTLAINGTAVATIQLSRGTTAAIGLFGSTAQTNTTTIVPATIWGYDAPSTTSSTTYAVQGKASSGTTSYPVTGNTMTIAATEIMA